MHLIGQRILLKPLRAGPSHISSLPSGLASSWQIAADRRGTNTDFTFLTSIRPLRTHSTACRNRVLGALLAANLKDDIVSRAALSVSARHAR